jgi:hypothetical protein
VLQLPQLLALPLGPNNNLLGGANIWNDIPGLFGPPPDPRSLTAPHKIAAEDLPPGLRQLQLVNIGFKSSKKAIPCPDLQTLQVERCKGARAFRLPDISRWVRPDGPNVLEVLIHTTS